MKPTRHPLFIPTGAGDLARFPPDMAMIAKLESSFTLLSVPSSGFPERVYHRLFNVCPHLRSLFPKDMQVQHLKLVATLQTVIDHLRDPKAIHTRLLELGRAHVAYGARPEHYPVVTREIVGAMGDVAGKAWSEDLAAEWTSAIGMVSAIMIEGGRGVRGGV
ncbi:MAG: hypothetical protein H7210_02400 [Pyrinomonadaceae bacterium]|nr:hypothetical protein [Phycisphaerales bacterium]